MTSVNFSPMEIGRRALAANQAGIDVTGNNIANINTPGYTRRRVQLAESARMNVTGYTIGSGVTITGIQSFRDNFIQSRIQTETGIAGRLNAERESLSPVEVALQGSDNGGLQNALNSFFGSFRDLDANPNSVPLRSMVAQKGVNLADAFQSTRNRLDELQQGIDGRIQSTVVDVNALSLKVAHLNEQIRSAVGAGGDAGNLMDQRSEAVNKLSELTGARSADNGDGTVTITIGEGRPLVAAERAFTLEAASTPPSGLSTITLDGQPAAFNEGAIRGFQNAITEVSGQISNLDGLAAAVVQRVNVLHTSGTDLDGNPGTNFFNNAVAVTAANISVNPAIRANSRLVVASPVAQPGTNGTIAGQIASLLSDPANAVGTHTGSFTTIFGSMLGGLGEHINTVDNGLQTQSAIIAQATAQRDSISGVSLDEEALNLMQYQKAFEAASRFIKIADEMTQMILSLGQ